MNIQGAEEIEEDGLVNSLDRFGEALIWVSKNTGNIADMEVTGNYIYIIRDDLHWFEHKLKYIDCDACEGICEGHSYWGTIVQQLGEFDAIALPNTPEPLRGFRVVDCVHQIIDRTWIE